MKKKEMAEQVIIVLNWAHENWKILTQTQQTAVSNGLRKDIWYASNKLTFKALMRFTKDELREVLHDVVEAIY